APVVGDDAVAVLEEEQHLRVPVIGRQRPAVAEDDGLTLSPVLVEDFDAVLGGDRAHRARSFARDREVRGRGAPEAGTKFPASARRAHVWESRLLCQAQQWSTRRTRTADRRKSSATGPSC